MRRAHRRWGRSSWAWRDPRRISERLLDRPSFDRRLPGTVVSLLSRPGSLAGVRQAPLDSRRTSCPSTPTARSGKSRRHCAASGVVDAEQRDPDRSLQREEPDGRRGFVPGRRESVRRLEDHVQRREVVGAIQRSRLRSRRPEVDRRARQSRGRGRARDPARQAGRPVARSRAKSAPGTDWKVASAGAKKKIPAGVHDLFVAQTVPDPSKWTGSLSAESRGAPLRTRGARQLGAHRPR